MELKIADFGKSEDCYQNYDIYQGRSSTSDFNLSVLNPWRWLPLELFDGGKLTTLCDIWAYGVTCWEIFSAAKLPYSDINFSSLDRLKTYLEKGNRLNKPVDCDMKIFYISKFIQTKKTENDFIFSVVSCWLKKAHRPLARHLVAAIEGIIVGVDAGWLSIDLEKIVNGEISDKCTKVEYFDQNRKPALEFAASTHRESKVIFTYDECSKANKINVFRKENCVTQEKAVDVTPYENFCHEN